MFSRGSWATKCRGRWASLVIVENRAGAGGNTGADAVAKAEPDGYTLLMSSAGILTANQFLYAKMPFDPETSFTPISVVAAMSMLVVVHPKVEATNAAGIRRARTFATRKDQLRIARSGYDRAPRTGAVHARGRHQAYPCSVSWGGAGGKRPHRGTDRWRGRQSTDGASAYQRRKAAPARSRGQTAPLAAARSADGGASRHKRFRGVIVVRHHGAGRERRPRLSAGSTARSSRPCASRSSPIAS